MNGISNARSKFHSAGAVLAIWLIAAPITLLPAAQTAEAQSVSSATAAENFVRTDLQRGMDILNNRNLSDADRRTQIREFLTSLTDIRRIALFTLGPMRQYASPAQVDQFVDAFRNYATAAYESQLAGYSGQSLSVTGSIQTAPNDYIVKTVLVDPAERTGRRGEPIEVDIRVASDNGRYAVTDLAIAGVWLGFEERDQFTAWLGDHNGDFGGLIVHLNVLTERLRNRAPAARIATEAQTR
jgi:phospholipid transport system substrate-binding protein